VLRTIRQIQAQVHTRFDFEGRMTLNRNPIFADVHDLMKIEHRSFGFCCERGVSGRLDLVSHAPATVG
jgi:hypothetical protein